MFDIEHKNQLRTAQANGRGIGIPHVKRKATQRFQLARSLSETGRQETWDALAEVAHLARCARAGGTFEDVHHPRNLKSPIGEQRRITIEKLSVLTANDGKFAQKTGSAAADFVAESIR